MVIELDKNSALSSLWKSAGDVQKNGELKALAHPLMIAHGIALILSFCLLYLVGSDPGSTFGTGLSLTHPVLVTCFLIHAPQVTLLLIATRKSRAQHELFYAGYQAAGGKHPQNTTYPDTKKDNLWRLIGGFALGSQPFLIFFIDRGWGGLGLVVALHLLLTGIYMSWALLAPYFEMHGLNYGQGRDFIAREFSGCMKFGLVAALLCLIPILQFRFITSVIAGTGKMVAIIENTNGKNTSEIKPIEAPA
jgi:hypothetical protein